MKRLGLLLLPILAITLLLGGNAFAQTVNTGIPDAYLVTYYSNANTSGAPDATFRLVNNGASSQAENEGIPDGNVWANIFVFDDSQEMQECCSCYVSADGLLSESVNKELTANELTGRAENTRGVIKVIASDGPDQPVSATQLAPGLSGSFMTHIQAGATKTTFAVTEDLLAESQLSALELAALDESCSFAITLGSGYGVCSCTLEDHDF